tara:strand:+ start:700 stop:2187 length:1488 start_codon:yes stop_codon:yes gene_type:complete
MAGYIGARSQVLSSTTVGKVQDLTATDTTPEVTIVNNTHEDTDGGREGKVIFKGQQSGGEESTLAEIQGSHDGTADDEKGDLIFKTNDGSDGASPTEAMRIDAEQNLGLGTNAPAHRLDIVESADAFGARITNNSDGSQGLQVRTSDNDGGQYILDLQTSSSATGTDYASKLFVEKSGKTTLTTTSAGASTTPFVLHNASSNASTDVRMLLASCTTAADRPVILASTNNGSNACDFTVSTPNGGTPAERMRILGNGVTLVGKSADDNTSAGATFSTGGNAFIRSGSTPLSINRLASDGTVVNIQQAGTTEGTISVSGSTVSYNGGHLARWSQLTDGSKNTSIVKGTVMTNLDQMAVWSHDAVEAQDAVVGDDGNVVSTAVDARDAYTEHNEQLNCMAVSSVEGDSNVAGVFVNWDDDDDEFNDMNVAMTGDMVIRIAKGVTIARGDLLMSAGDGTAKPQDDDIVRSKTIAKVTSTNVSHTYDDESFCVPCVLMAC